MLVVATERGYGGKPEDHQIREPGDKFEMPDGTKDSKWFKAIKSAKPGSKPEGEELT